MLICTFKVILILWAALYRYIKGVTEMQVQNWTMPIKTKNKTFYMNDKKRQTA